MLRRGALALLALATVVSTLAVIAAPVAADHVYSHRYVVFGRVIDSLGQPAMGWSASATLSGPTVEGPCSLPPTAQPDTNGYGDFFLCFHVHGISTGTITISGPRLFTQTLALDPNLRRSNVEVRLDAPWPTKDPSIVRIFHMQYTVRGRVWQPEPGGVLEGVPVSGIALPQQAVSIDFAYNSGSTHPGSSTTNNYGDYRSLIPLGSNLTQGSTQVSAAGSQAAPLAADPEFMLSNIDVIVPQPQNPVVGFLVSYYWVVLAVIGVVVASWYVLTHARPRKAARDVARIPGIGRSKAEALRNAGVGTIDQLAAASSKDLADRTGLSTKETKRLIRKAKEVLEAERTGPPSADKD